MAGVRPVLLATQLRRLWDGMEALQDDVGDGGSSGPHTHTIANVTGLQSELDGKQTAGDYAAADHNHAGTYSLVGHVHPISEVNGLGAALDDKQDAGDYAAADHGHAIADVTGLQAALDGKQASGSYSLTSHNHDGVYALAAHSHTIANVTGLQTALDGKAATSHAHVIADVTGLQTALDGKQASGSYSLTSHNHSGVYAPVSHSHVIADVTGLQTALDGKQASGSYSLTSHNHSGVYEPVIAAGTTGQYWRGDKTWQTLPGGADPWTYIKLGNDFTTSSASAVDVTGMNFTPAANTTYEFEAHLMCRTATATVGPRPGLAWPTGGSDGAASIYTPSSGTAETMVHGNIGGALLAAVGGLPNTTSSYGAKVQGIFVAGASPSGTVKLQLASETGGTNVTVKAGSFLKYRTI